MLLEGEREAVIAAQAKNNEFMDDWNLASRRRKAPSINPETNNSSSSTSHQYATIGYVYQDPDSFVVPGKLKDDQNNSDNDEAGNTTSSTLPHQQRQRPSHDHDSTLLNKCGSEFGITNFFKLTTLEQKQKDGNSAAVLNDPQFSSLSTSINTSSANRKKRR
jgi:hypothetical protein